MILTTVLRAVILNSVRPIGAHIEKKMKDVNTVPYTY